MYRYELNTIQNALAWGGGYQKAINFAENRGVWGELKSGFWVKAMDRHALQSKARDDRVGGGASLAVRKKQAR